MCGLFVSEATLSEGMNLQTLWFLLHSKSTRSFQNDLNVETIDHC